MLEEDVKKLADGANFAALTTLLPDGQPMTHAMWVDHDDEHVIINTEVARTKFANMQRDPRVTVMVWDRDDPYHYAEVRGRVVDTIRGPEARAHIDALSRKYTGRDYDESAIGSERVMVKIAPHRQRVYGG